MKVLSPSSLFDRIPYNKQIVAKDPATKIQHMPTAVTIEIHTME
jgi:hypothetical protein